jgi:hypothetical protein
LGGIAASGNRPRKSQRFFKRAAHWKILYPTGGGFKKRAPRRFKAPPASMSELLILLIADVPKTPYLCFNGAEDEKTMG